MSNVNCPKSSVQSQMSKVKCPTSGVQSQSVQSQVPNGKCPRSRSVQGQVAKVECPKLMSSVSYDYYYYSYCGTLDFSRNDHEPVDHHVARMRETHLCQINVIGCSSKIAPNSPLSRLTLLSVGMQKTCLARQALTRYPSPPSVPRCPTHPCGAAPL